ncbi:hypothetical protein SCHPADRAFT_897039, partial [Schizopora paradoxa]
FGIRNYESGFKFRRSGHDESVEKSASKFEVLVLRYDPVDYRLEQTQEGLQDVTGPLGWENRHESSPKDEELLSPGCPYMRNHDTHEKSIQDRIKNDRVPKSRYWCSVPSWNFNVVHREGWSLNLFCIREWSEDAKDASIFETFSGFTIDETLANTAPATPRL